MNRHLISAADLSRDDALLILDTAEELARMSDRPIKKLPTLRGRTVVNLFFEDSTRTRISFEAAAKRLSADVINFSAKGSSVAKGESLKDTALTLEAMGADAVVIRHVASGAPHRLAGWIRGHVVNAGDGMHEHPTQALLDAFTIRRRLGLQPGAGSTGPGRTNRRATSPAGSRAAGRGGSRTGAGGLDGVRVTIVGDVLHSRVARSNIALLNTLGAEVTLVAPPTLLPIAVDGWSCDVSYDLDAVLPKSDVIMMLRVQQERMTDAYFPSVREYSRRYGLDGARMAMLPEHAIVMHPGPMNRGVEIAAEVADSSRSTIVEQVANGVSVRMAVLYLLLGGAELTGEPR
jgi:aspartate carbamoyltransferase catalytic subunit